MKRIFDVTIVLVTSVAWVPLIIGVAVAVRVMLGSPVLFTQLRPGLHGRPFRLAKFRTMIDQAPPGERALSDAERLTAFGRFLRSTSLDELPELWNVLIGDMSLVGPRPLLMEYLPLYSAEQARRHNVLPGLTGWAQINGRNALSWEEKFALDTWYVDHQSTVLDLQILWRTVTKVLRREGINSSDELTMPRFTGTGHRL